MSKDENAGLLSKVVKFVKNPTTSWSDLDLQEPDRESGYSKQMLKEMIERKRRNDFVRKREFDMLRKLRRSEVMAGHDPGARPSFFQSSMPSKPDDRATTLKKIDEIEAQMSMQWWKTKHGDAASAAGNSSSFPVSSHMPPDSVRGGLPSRQPRPGPYDPTEPQPLAPTPVAKEAPPDDLMPMLMPELGLPSQPVSQPPAPPMAEPPGQGESVGPGSRWPRTPAASPRPLMSPLNALTPAADSTGASTGFSASKLFAIDVEEFAHDPELEEAAIRFANGDNSGAEAGLLEVLAPSAPRADHDETWLTLFDLYRATGQQERFETAALDFANRLGRSAPQWFSMPEVVKRMQSAPGASAPEHTGNQPLAHWTAPSSIGTQTLAAMTAALAKAQPPWRLNWTKINAIEEAAVEGLTRVFTQWASEPVQLRFIGGDSLERVLKTATPSGDRSVKPAWWKLRMEVLRVMHRPDEFELVALDYCVTYEVSPPSWDSARCEFKPLQPDGSYVAGHTIVGEAFRDSLTSGLNNLGYGDTNVAPVTQQQAAQIASIELAGEIIGDAVELLDLLESKLLGADIVVISCARLIRIDFSAAGSLLNWVSTRQAEGRQVQFVEVNRLVAAFFNVIGISEHARVIARND
jgi:ABC-type transporter Mla MlaB component